ncbi:hypothetical protein E2F50_13145 [Rhizobium deserti]|uniref:HK97 gp10 family phage protein n=1 Tax=Rhizobium deserti TaxID=2547961 RepID=A0A4R5UGY4_9HYPH|nr:HK97-gp10 family putative phage morphogenesis protein [Rhizobium deserti]TDK35201.1 hypothetical protein E2F50_13145 [Rhizobium deserti]
MARTKGFSVRVDGLKDLDQALKKLPRATAKSVGRRTLMKAAQPIAEAGRANAPEREGNLKKSYGVGTKLTKRQKRMNKKESPVEVFVGPNDPAAVQTEFGNQHQAAEPHLRPAWDAEKQPTLERIKDGLWVEISKAAARLARKAAKLAKGK